jgi:outer membrane lipoprotein SlyB
MAIQQGAVMNKNLKKLAVAALAVAGLAGCATTQTVSRSAPDGAQAAERQVSRPLRSYGSLGGYRYRRFVAVTVREES